MRFKFQKLKSGHCARKLAGHISTDRRLRFCYFHNAETDFAIKLASNTRSLSPNLLRSQVEFKITGDFLPADGDCSHGRYTLRPHLPAAWVLEQTEQTLRA